MAGKGFLTIHLESIQRRENYDLVIKTLTRQPFAVRCKRHRWHRVHCRVCNVFYVHWNVPLPDSHTFVVRRGHEPTILINEGDCVDCAQMPIVFLNYVTASNVPL